jgi:hypothetical protein
MLILKNNLILLAYGSTKEYKMAVLVVLSFWAWYGIDHTNTQFIIYTDNPDYFPAHLEGTNVEYRMITPQKWEEMLHGYTFKFHRKMAIIEETFMNYPLDNVIFLDSDVFFYANPSKILSDISDKVSYMHVRELTLDKQMTFIPDEAKVRYIHALEHGDIIVGGKRHHVNKDTYIWNAGVIGMSPAIAPYVNDVRRITEDIYQMTAVHISEQLAHTFVLEALTELKTADHYIVHYWKMKDLIETSYASFFTNDFIAKPLQQRLDTIKVVTQVYGRNFDLICYMKEAQLAIENKNYNVGFKATVKAIMQMLKGKGNFSTNVKFFISLVKIAGL